MLLPCSAALAAGKPSFQEDSISLAVGQTYDLVVKHVAKDVTGTFISSNTAVAAVDQKGRINGIAEGTAKITLSLMSGGKKYTLIANVTVYTGAKTVMIENKCEKLAVGQTIDLKYSMSPAASKDKVSWSSDHEAVASVDADGKLSAKQPGEAVIRAVTLSGARDSFTVIVEDETTKVFTSRDVNSVNNYLLVVNQTFENVYLSNSIGNINIKFDKCTINGTLTVEAGVKYNIEVTATKIAAIRVVNPGNVLKPSFNMPKANLFIRKGTVVKDVILGAACYFNTAEADGMGSLSIAPLEDGEYDITLSSYRGDLLVDYTCKAAVRLELVNSSIQTATINQASGKYFLLTGNENYPSTVAAINQKSGIYTIYDTQIEQVNLDSTVKEISIQIASPVKTLVHCGANIEFRVTKAALLGEVIDQKNSAGKYGVYQLCDDKNASITFSVKAGKRGLDDFCIKDLVKLLTEWKNTSKPFTVPNQKDVVLTCVAKNTYQFNLSGDKVTLGFDPDKEYIKLYGNKNVKLTQITTTK
jgi:uncharacterized protein YjdB